MESLFDYPTLFVAAWAALALVAALGARFVANEVAARRAERPLPAEALDVLRRVRLG
jgi:hypothetical protein